jgi:hypothetical protein
MRGEEGTRSTEPLAVENVESNGRWVGVRVNPPNDSGLKRPDVEDGENRKDGDRDIGLFGGRAGGQDRLSVGTGAMLR